MEQKNYCDMHIHTTYSDGELSVSELLKYAKQKNLKKLSITDHDCVDAYFEIKNNYIDFDGEILIGCEFSCFVYNIPIEILGYGFDLKKIKSFLDLYGFPQSKLDKIHCSNFINVCKKFDVDIDFDYDTSYQTCKNFMKHKLLYQDIIKNDIIFSELKQIDDRFVESSSNLIRFGINNPNSKLFQNSANKFCDVKKVVDIIHGSGGLCFVAHPYQYGENMFAVLNKLKDIIDGVEVYHYTSDTKQKQQPLILFCKQHNLLMSGGSDYHYVIDILHKKDKLNELKVPSKLFEKILNKVKYKNL